MKRHLALIVLAPLALAACGQDTSGVPPLPNPPPNKIDISGPITARGVDPVWSLRIDGTTMTLKRDGLPDLTATAPGAVIEPGQVRWNATGDQARAVTVTLYSSDCTDGTGGKRLPLAAEVDITSEVLHGCATPAAAPAAKKG